MIENTNFPKHLAPLFLLNSSIVSKALNAYVIESITQ